MINISMDLLPHSTISLIKDSTSHKETEINSDLISENQQLVEDLHKPVIRNLKAHNVYSSF